VHNEYALILFHGELMLCLDAPIFGVRLKRKRNKKYYILYMYTHRIMHTSHIYMLYAH
jgi:hypothetical protein